MIQDQLKFIEFVQGNRSFESWLRGIEVFDSAPVSFDQIPTDAREHERKHLETWVKYNVRAAYYIDTEGFPFVFPNIDDLKELYNRVGKIKFIEICTEVVTAPVSTPDDLTGTDRKLWLILTGKIKSADELNAYRLSQI